jgi:hypothetical protein
MTTRFKIRLELYPYLAALVVLYLLSLILRVIYTNCLLLSCYRFVDHLMPLITHLLKVMYLYRLKQTSHAYYNLTMEITPNPWCLFHLLDHPSDPSLDGKVNGDERNSNPQKVLAPNE